MMRVVRLGRLERLRRHERDSAAQALHRAQEDLASAAVAAARARERRRQAEEKFLAEAARPQPALAFLREHEEVLERLDAERGQFLKERHAQRLLAERRVQLRRAMVREEQMKSLGQWERRRQQREELRGEQRELDDLPPKEGPAW